VGAVITPQGQDIIMSVHLERTRALSKLG